MTQDPREKDELERTPDTGDEWFALIRPHIDVSPEAATDSEVLMAAKRHAEQVADRTGMDIDLKNITWQTSWALKAKHGYQPANRVKLSLHTLEANGWQRLMQTVRHELIHVWQHQHDAYDSAGTTKFEKAHGASFERWMPVVNVSKRGDSVLGWWTIECPACHTVIHRFTKRRKNQVAKYVQEHESVTCQDCEQTTEDYLIKREGEDVDRESLPEISIPTERHTQVFLYNNPGEQAGAIEFDWHPETRALTDLPGVGDATAVALGEDIQTVDDLLDQDGGGLSPSTRAQVSSQYHDSLRETVFEWYGRARLYRSEDDLARLQQVVDDTESDWWQPLECIDGVGQIDQTCRLLRSTVEVGDHLELTFKDGGTGTVQVEQQPEADTGSLIVSVQTGATIDRSEARIRIPDAPHTAYPVFTSRLQRSDSTDVHTLEFHEDKHIVDATRVSS